MTEREQMTIEVVEKISEMSMEEIEFMMNALEKEKAERLKKKEMELIKKFCEAYRELVEEVPLAELLVPNECEDCGADYCINLLEYLEYVKPDAFSNL